MTTETQARPTFLCGLPISLLELVRHRLRNLVQHVEKFKKGHRLLEFPDEIGEGVEHELPQVGEADFVPFKQKARRYRNQRRRAARSLCAIRDP